MINVKSGKTIECDYLVIGAGIGLKYKLLGKTILVDKNPFGYKIGESFLPALCAVDYGLFSLIHKYEKLENFTRKNGTVFYDLTHGHCSSIIHSRLGEFFSFHCERSEYEKFMAEKLSLDIVR